MEWKTLQEVFEEMGSVFPFTVLVNRNTILSRFKETKENPIEVTFVRARTYGYGTYQKHWYPKDYVAKSNDNVGLKVQKHYVWAYSNSYANPKPLKFDKDMEKLLK